MNDPAIVLPTAFVMVTGPQARDWMTTSSWIVSEVVIAFFLLMTLKSLLGA
jgi:hypothetical protein